ncbi:MULTISPECIES: sugar ABC transporter substrate-binding protein [unclassified Amycolatopsis]|uniref:ABC transporter substrate-binding protein n=1 Tax=unclassified Amycolatopsis TaxID=2618356 RepID=UPI002875BC9D|nr:MULTISPECIES: sugar ABC transporter substrate-binding protein [unclassified Amycolatopsis]MDS0132186.1 sugar ABC transporter substrate-binding protein [Amycolatopsis sp. 505]MDS0141076.1 sugar ABC transporter substrate-binding protein [Amycolatopsis sp. CM201R]
MSRIRTRAKAAAALALAAALAVGCSSGGTSSAPAAATGTQDSVDAALKAGGEITYWSWTPSAKDQVAAFQKEYPNVKVNYVNAGTNKEEYTKLQNAIKAGSGAPDVAQIEYYALPQFALTDSLADLNQFGFGSFEKDYSASTWAQVKNGNGIYGLPQDSGPMALFYNKEVFDKNGIAVPKTWAEYIDAAKKLHTADPTKYITSDTGDPGFVLSMIWQAGGHPFTVDGRSVKVNLADAGTKKWTAMWDQLIQGKLLAPVKEWSDDWFRALGDGTISSLVTGAWMPGNFISSVPGGAGKWAVAPMPTYDGKPVTAENGGSAQSVVKQSKNPALAAGFVRWLNHAGGVQPFIKSGGFPSTTADLTSPAFVDEAVPYFGGQKVNQVLTQASKDVAPGWTYLPYQTYANSIFSDTAGKAYLNATPLDAGLAAWQQAIVDYGNQQGFTVSAG